MEMTPGSHPCGLTQRWSFKRPDCRNAVQTWEANETQLQIQAHDGIQVFHVLVFELPDVVAKVAERQSIHGALSLYSQVILVFGGATGTVVRVNWSNETANFPEMILKPPDKSRV